MAALPAGSPAGIIDAHLHLTTEAMIRRMQGRASGQRQAAVERSRPRGMTWEDRLKPVLGVTLEQHAATWLHAFDEAGVEGGVFIAVGEANDEMAAFVALNPARLHAVGSLADPRHPDAARAVRAFRERGLVGLKLYPPIQRFLANDRTLYPIYEACAEQNLAVIFHFGITVGAFYDLSYASPLPLSAAVKDFPEVTFVIAHFGAGFLRETLFLAYHTDNVCVDTSGTNNWRQYYPGEPSLEQVFRDALRAFGPERVLFGTDSTVWGGYRHHILKEQLDVLDRLELTPAARALVLRENARRVFRLPGTRAGG